MGGNRTCWSLCESVSSVSSRLWAPRSTSKTSAAGYAAGSSDGRQACRAGRRSGRWRSRRRLRAPRPRFGRSRYVATLRREAAWQEAKNERTQALIERPRNAKTAEVVPIICAGPEARASPHILRIEVPGTAAYHAEAAISTARPRRAVARRPRVVAVPAVLHPLPHVARHVVQAPRVGRERPGRGRATVPAASAPVAVPKSISTGDPSPRTITFAGLMSRCRRPAACIADTPSVSVNSRARTRSAGSGPSAATASCSVRPSTYSITMYAVPFAENASYTCTICGCLNCASTCASCRNRPRPHS